MKSGILVLIGLAATLAAGTPRQRQGIEGYVFRISGNRMPSVGAPRSRPRGFQTTLYVFAVAGPGDVTRSGNGGFFSAVRTRLLRRVRTDTAGYFRLTLPPGEYSLLVRKDSLYYANVVDDRNRINPVKVSPGKMTGVTVNVDYDATY